MTQIGCYGVGTLLRTTEGDVRIEALRPGQQMVLADGGVATLVWVGERAIDCTRAAEPEQVWPARILRDAFAPGVPQRDLVLSPEHAVFHAGVLIPIRALLNGATVVREERVWVHYLHVELDRHAVVLAENLPAESWLDRGDRGLFGNAPKGGGAGDARETDPHVPGCAPLEDAGPAVTALRRPLLERALVLGFMLEHRPELHLRLDGRRVAVEDAVLDHRVRQAVITSRTGIPARQDAHSTDDRTLGVMLSGLVLRDPFEERRIGLDHPALIEGFSEPERENGVLRRWTTGAAVLPGSLWAGMTGPVRVEIEIAASCAVWADRLQDEE